MKKIFLVGMIIGIMPAIIAQPVSRQSIEDSMIGWIKLYHFKGAKESFRQDNRTYSVAQLSICDSFANWMQASFFPKGGLGDVKKVVSGKIGPYNQYEQAMPQSYGARVNVYTDLKYNSSRKLVPAANYGYSWEISANLVPGWPVRDLCTPTRYIFTMPSYESTSDEESVKKIHDLSKLEQLKPYTTFWIKNIEAGNGTDYVLLSKNNQSPFIKLTKGEYLQLMEEAIPIFYAEEKRKIHEQNKGNARSIDYFMSYLESQKKRLEEGLENNRKKYSNRLAEIALVNSQPRVIDLDNARDLFSSGYLTDAEQAIGRVPVYKVDPVMSGLSKQDQPQWIVMSWWWAPNNAGEKHMHESIINNFNFDYLYHFFFDPAKVKGQSYKPIRSPAEKEVIVISELSENAKKNKSDKSIHFYEDFSSSGIGKKPIGWKTGLAADGSSPTVTRLEGLPGHWVMMNGDYSIIPTQVKKPFPENFTLSYEVVAAQNFTWGAKGLLMKLSKETSPGNDESFLSLRLRPGFDGRDGEATLETKFTSPPGYSNQTKWLKAPGFSNHLKNNRVTVTIKKSGEQLSVFIDKNKIAEYEKAIPAAHLFNAISFSSGSSGDNNRYYISNIKISKD